MNPPLRIAPGTVIDGITIGELLHTGGMSLIYRASRPDCAFPLVVKVPRFGHGEPSTSVVSYEIERMMFERLSGSHLPRFVGAGDLQRQPYLAMEFVEGRSGEEWVGKGPVAPQEVARLGAAIATAAHSLHMQEAIHLDLKPGNVIIRLNGDRIGDRIGHRIGHRIGEAVLIDLGLAHHAQFPDLLTEEFQRPIGSAPYIAPEQVLAVRCDPRSDIFAIGVMLYEFATGRLPYGTPSSARGLRARCYRDPAPPRNLVPDLPAWLQEVILRCLEPDARHRYASAAQLAFDLSNPEQVEITGRGKRERPAGIRTRLSRWIKVAGYEPAPCPPPTTQIANAPIILVAVALGRAGETVSRPLADATRRAVQSQPEARVVFATVVRPVPDWGSSDPHRTSARERLRHLVALREWAAALDLPEERRTFHVLESNDPAQALLDFARANNVDLIIIGTPLRLDDRSHLGTVGTRVVTNALCDVTVVRARDVERRTP